jgi:hypothetical protein
MNPTWNTASFNGLIFTLIPPGAAIDITAAAIDSATTMTGFDLSRITFDSDSIESNWNGLGYTNGTVVSVDFTTVPEPASLALFASVLIGLGAVRRRKRKPAFVPGPNASRGQPSNFIINFIALAGALLSVSGARRCGSG